MLTEPRLEAETDAQQVTKVERGYNVYQANCARCHGAQGEGGIGPVLNDQDKLFVHLNENYLRNVPDGRRPLRLRQPEVSLMPVWADTATPPGPLNYRQIDELIAFLRAHRTTRRSPSAIRAPARPEDRSGHRQGHDVQGLARPELQAGARRDAVSRTAGRTQFASGGGGSAAPSAGRVDRPGRRRS